MDLRDGLEKMPDEIKKLIVQVLQEVLESGHELGGMGEYGKGWNDARIQMKMIVKEMISKTTNERLSKHSLMATKNGGCCCSWVKCFSR